MDIFNVWVQKPRVYLFSGPIDLTSDDWSVSVYLSSHRGRNHCQHPLASLTFVPKTLIPSLLSFMGWRRNFRYIKLRPDNASWLIYVQQRCRHQPSSTLFFNITYKSLFKFSTEFTPTEKISLWNLSLNERGKFTCSALGLEMLKTFRGKLRIR